MQVGFIGIIGEQLKSDPWPSVERAAGLGYTGVEHPGNLLDGDDAAANAHRLRDLGLEPLTLGTAIHALRDDPTMLLDQAERAKVPRVTCWWAPADSRDELLRDIDVLNRVGQAATGRGLTFAYHHHDHELNTQFDGEAAFDLIAANTDAAHVQFVVDLAWAAIGGRDPDEMVRSLESRIAAVHVKDAVGPHRDSERDVLWTALGTGDVPLRPALAAAQETGVPWAIFEQDRPRNLDPWESLTAARLYLRELGF